MAGCQTDFATPRPTVFDVPLPWTWEQSAAVQDAGKRLVTYGRTLLKVRGNPFLSTDDRARLDVFLNLIEEVQR